MLVLLKPWDPTKTKRGRGNRSQHYVDLRMGHCSSFYPSSYFIFLFFPPLLPPFVCSSLHICQAFIKQLEEGVSFPWSSCQLFPISPAPWKSLADTPLSRPGAQAGAGVYAHMFKAGTPSGEVLLDTGL